MPYPVDRRAMDRSTELLCEGIEQSRLGNKERLDAIRRLRRFVPPDVAVAWSVPSRRFARQ
ncbi:MAG: hypothetical protein ABR879_06825 [Methanomassiliicoccales archaeon]